MLSTKPYFTQPIPTKHYPVTWLHKELPPYMASHHKPLAQLPLAQDSRDELRRLFPSRSLRTTNP